MLRGNKQVLVCHIRSRALQQSVNKLRHLLSLKPTRENIPGIISLQTGRNVAVPRIARLPNNPVIASTALAGSDYIVADTKQLNKIMEIVIFLQATTLLLPLWCYNSINDGHKGRTINRMTSILFANSV